jgi:ATP-dependent DNA helicase RecQ
MASLGTVSEGRRRAPRLSASADVLAPEDEEVFQRLRGLRKDLADEQRVPAYIVFSDKVLIEMATRRPASERELLAVPGVGPAKLEKYGAAFLAALRS